MTGTAPGMLLPAPNIDAGRKFDRATLIPDLGPFPSAAPWRDGDLLWVGVLLALLSTAIVVGLIWWAL